MRITVPEALAGERVDRAVAFATSLPRATVAALVTDGRVRINGAAVTARSRRVAEGDVLDVEVPDAVTPELEGDAGVDIPVTFEDDFVVVVDKPAGLVVHPGAGTTAATLVHGLVARYPDLAAQPWPDRARPGIVHRLDKGTSGLLVVARTPAAGEHLSAQLKMHSVERRYYALVHGIVEANAGTIDAPIGRSARDRTRMAVSAAGREARTHYTVLERIEGANARWTMVECKLDTGRTHQIRVHLSAIGHPVAGDARYRGGKPTGLTRPFLHAHALAFDHPDSDERMSFTSPLPGDLDEVRRAVRAAQ